MEVDLQSLFGLHVTWCAQLCTHWLRLWNPRIWNRITRAPLVSKDRRHLLVTPRVQLNTWSPNKPWRSNSIFNRWVEPRKVGTSALTVSHSNPCRSNSQDYSPNSLTFKEAQESIPSTRSLASRYDKKGYRARPPGHIGLWNRFLGIDSWPP